MDILAAWWRSRRELNFLALLLALSLIRGLLYATIVPPWQAPDEPYHFLSAQLPGLASDPTPDAAWERIRSETASSLEEFHYWDWNIHEPAMRASDEVNRGFPAGFHFTEQSKPRSYVYHLLSSWLRLAPGQEIVFQLYWARLASVLTNLGIVAVAYLTARLLFGDDPFGLILLPLTIVFHPLHTYILSVVNDGNVAELFASLAVFFWIWGVTRRWHWSRIAGLGIFALLAIAAKPTAFYLALAIPIWVILRYIGRIVRVKKLIYVVAAIGLAIGATFFSKYLQGYILVAWKTAQMLLEGQHSVELGGLGQSVFDTFRAFWVRMGWTSLRFSDVWGNLLLVLSLLAGLGVLKHVLTPVTSAGENGRFKEAILVLMLCVLTSASLVPLFILTYGLSLGQSRYLFSAILPFMALLVIGWRELIPPKWRVEGLALLASFFFLSDTVVLLNYGLPFYYPLWR